MRVDAPPVDIVAGMLLEDTLVDDAARDEAPADRILGQDFPTGGAAQLREVYDEHHKEVARRRNDRDVGQHTEAGAGLTFPPVRDDSDVPTCDAPFVDPEQQWVVFNSAHLHLPPRVLDGRNPGLRLCGTFPDVESAREYALDLHSRDPDCSVLLAPTHAWTVAASCREQVVDGQWANAQCNRLLAAHNATVERQRCEFEIHRSTNLGEVPSDDSDSPKTMIEQMMSAQAPCRGPQVPIPESGVVAQDTEESIINVRAVAEECPDSERRTHSRRFPRDCEIRDQTVAVVVFLRDEFGDPAHFAFNVLACFADEVQANRWIRNVACQSIMHHDIDIVSMYEWVYPQSADDANTMKRVYRNPEQNKVMNFQQQQVGAVDGFRRFCESQGHDVPTIDIG